MAPPLKIPTFTEESDMAAEIFRSTDSSTVRPRNPESFKVHADRANKHVTAMIRRYAETNPIERGTDMFDNLSRIATLYACMLHYRSVHQRTQADMYAVSYKEAVEAIQDYLKTEPTGRQSSFSFDVTDSEANRLVPYSQVGLAGRLEYLLS